MRELVVIFMIAAGMVSSCAMPDPEPPKVQMEASFWIHGDTRFVREERLIFEMACEKWRAFSRGGANLWIVWDLDEERLLALQNEPRLLKVDSMDSRTQAVDAAQRGRGKARGFLHPPDDRYPMIMGVVSDRIPELFPVALHELGHAAGLDELPPGEKGVMCKTNPAWKFTEADHRECARVGVCRGPF